MPDLRGLLAAGAALLALLLLGVAVWLMARERGRKLRARVRDIGGRARATSDVPVEALPSIRVAAQSDRPFRQRMARLLGFNR